MLHHLLRPGWHIWPLLTACCALVLAGALFEDRVATRARAGSEGSASGLNTPGNQLWTQDSTGILGVAEAGDRFGYALAAGDFDGDGWQDLAVGAPYETVSGVTLAGAVSIIYGGGGGLSGTSNELWTEDTNGVVGVGEVSGLWGWELAAGDFDGDGHDDLAVGAPWKNVSGTDSGAVTILYGSPAGLEAEGSQFWSQESPGLLGNGAEAFDRFGDGLATGDFDGDNRDDLAIGVPGDSVNGNDGAGSAHVLYGSAGGLNSAGNEYWHQEQPDVQGVAEVFDSFGAALAAGDGDGDGRDDLAIGVPGEAVGVLDGAGAVNVLYGSGAGLTAVDNQIWHQDTLDVLGAAEAGDSFGAAVTWGDFDGDGADDLVIGAPSETIIDVVDAGGINVLYGTLGVGLSAAGNQRFDQEVTGMLGLANDDDHFGASLTSADFNSDGDDDLAIGIPDDDRVGAMEGGAVAVMFGTAGGLAVDGNLLWDQNTGGVEGATVAADHFGHALAAGDFNGDGAPDLAIGVPDDGEDGLDNAGAVNVLYANAPPATATPTPTLEPTNTPVTPGPTNTPPAPTNTPPAGATPTPTSPAGGLIGDVNCDGSVNSIDAAILLQLAAGLIGGVGCPANADVNEDGQVNAIDAQLILQYSAGLIGQLPP
jgi:hypothetical protein